MIYLNHAEIDTKVRLNTTIRVNNYPDESHVYEEGKVGRILDVYDVGTGRDAYTVIDVEFEDGSCLLHCSLLDYDEV